MKMESSTATTSNSAQWYIEPPTIICGSLSMQRKKTFFSENSTLILVFHTTTRAPFEQSAKMSGFQGNFLFLNACKPLGYLSDFGSSLYSRANYHASSYCLKTKITTLSHPKHSLSRFPDCSSQDSEAKYIF